MHKRRLLGLEWKTGSKAKNRRMEIRDALAWYVFKSQNSNSNVKLNLCFMSCTLCWFVCAVNEGLATLAFTGVEVNMVLFSKSALRQSNAESATMFSTWMGSVYLFSLLGAFFSDSYLGRYLTCVIFQVILTIVSQPFTPFLHNFT